MDEENIVPPKKVILRRGDVIQQNLSGIETHNLKKKMAQQRFYQRAEHISPLLANTNKPPVHSRLGKNKIILRRYRPMNNTQYINMVKPRMKKDGLLTQKYRLNNNERLNFGPKYSAQRRIEKIRRANMFNANNSGKIILRRTRPNQPAMARNLTVQVKNNSLHFHQPIHSVRNSLNKELQDEIILIQSECLVPQEIPNLPIYLGAVGITKINLHNRFSSYP